MSLPPGVADPEAMPDGMGAYEVASGPEAPLEEPAAGDEGAEAAEAWARAVEEVVEVEGPVMVRRVARALGVEEGGEGAVEAVARAFAIEGEKLTEEYRGWIAGALAPEGDDAVGPS